MKTIRILFFVPLILILVSWCFTLISKISGIEKNYYMLVLFQQVLAIFLPTYLYYKRKDKSPYLKKKDLSFNNFEDTLIFILLGICLQFIGSLANFPIVSFFAKFGIYSTAPMMQINSFWDFILSVLILCLLPSIFEEVLFRKFIYDDLRQYSKNTAIFFSALFFSFAHMNFYNISSLFIIGLVLGIMRARNFPLIHLMLCHFFINFTGLMLTIVSKYPNYQYFFDNHYVLLLAVFAFIVLLILKKTANPPEQFEFNYYKRPTLEFLKSIYKIPVTYIYLAVFITMGIINLF